MFKKSSFVITMSLLSLAAFAGENSTATTETTSDAVATPYFGMQFGSTYMNYKANEWSKVNTSSADKNKFIGRALLGYAWNEFLSAELGYTYFDKPTFQENVSGTKKKFHQYGLDLTGIASVPFSHGLGLYGKAGLISIFRGALAEDQYFYGHTKNTKLTELLGVGLFYNLNRHIFTDLTWTRIFRNGDLPRMDLFTLGLTCKFKT